MSQRLFRSHQKVQQLRTGIGLRKPHYDSILENLPAVGFLEIHSENFFHKGTQDYHILEQCASHYPMSFHGVGLSLGSADGVSVGHLKSLKNLIENFQALYVSEHISWNAFQGKHFPDLLPMPLTKDSLDVLTDNINKVQDILGHQILVENPSTYVDFRVQTYHEAEFLNLIVEKTGCGLLLDINNVYVSSHNISFSPDYYLEMVNPDFVKEIHLAGFEVKQIDGQEIYIDAHNHPVVEAVWSLFGRYYHKFPHANVLIEWDRNIPSLDRLLSEATRADMIRAQIMDKVSSQKYA